MAAESAAKKKEAEETYAGYAEDVKLDLIRCVMALPEVKRSGYAPRTRRSPGWGSDGARGDVREAVHVDPAATGDAAQAQAEGCRGGADGGADGEGEADGGAAEDEEPPGAPGGDGRGGRRRDDAPILVRAERRDPPQDRRRRPHARSLKDEYLEEYEAYVEWARAEEEAAKTADGAKRLTPTR